MQYDAVMRGKRFIVWLLVGWLLVVSAACSKEGERPEKTKEDQSEPKKPAKDETKGSKKKVYEFSAVDGLVTDSIGRGDIPGAVVLIGQGDEVLYRKAYGDRAVEPRRQRMEMDTVFDLASLTKPIATGTAIAKLAEMGSLKIGDRVSKYLPEFAANGKANVTIEQLLLHVGGMAPANSMRDYANGPEAAVKKILTDPPRHIPGERFAYSDLGYITLGKIVEKVSGMGLDAFVEEYVFDPLGMVNTVYLPPTELRKRCALTEKREGRWMQGEVHDPRAYALGGVAGHAGLFSTADDLSRYAQMILNRGTLGERRVLLAETVNEMIQRREIGNAGGRAYGFDVDSPYSSSRGLRFARRTTITHTGYTGTMMTIDPVNKVYVIFLTNRVHPKDVRGITGLRRALATVAAEIVLSKKDGVLTGIDMLRRTNFRELQESKVGLITNHTGLSREGGRTIDVLRSARGVKLVRLFSPEHGLHGKVDEKVGHAVDRVSRLKVFSLYGDNRRPSDESLKGIDTLVFDIQDVGTRFYTYVTTLAYAMEEAAKRKIKMVVLDRPNPIRGLKSQGPVLDEGMESFIGYKPIPLVHGMTIGELAKMYNEHFGIGCDLQVVKMAGWKRGMWWDETGLTWVNPSPNMRNVNQAVLYPAIGLMEATNLSVGRGTDQPFELFGAPWIDVRRGEHRELAETLAGLKLPGVSFVPIAFTPNASKFVGERCGGVFVVITDRDAMEPAKMGVRIAGALWRLFGDRFEMKKMQRMLSDEKVMWALLNGKVEKDVGEMWKEELKAFEKIRGKYLLYD